PHDSIIIGAGISGLAAAHHLKRSGQNVLLIESSDRVGGVMQSLDAEGFIVERGPNSLRGTHELLDLIEEVGLMDDLLAADPKAPAYVYFKGQLHAVPTSLSSFVKSQLLSASGKMRLLSEPFVKARRESGEESLASFFRRRLGNQVVERMIAPFVSGVYAGDAEKLSIQASFSRLAEFERDAGSIIRGAVRAMRSSRKNQDANKPKRSLRPYRLCSFRRGLEQLPEAIAKQLGENLLLNTQVKAIKQTIDTSSNFEITVEQKGEHKSFLTKSLIIATPADAASRLLAEVTPEISALVADIPYTSIVSLPLAYRRDQVAHSLNGFGFLAPRSEGLRTLGSVWGSSLFPGRTPQDWVYFTNFIGGETDREAINLSDSELVKIVHGELQKVLGIAGEPHLLP
ncbi:MAG TPA: protoporphyrinogen oxidase, partial [Blastocatellia bacterium]|nr:protoporphyrinogen oxidase [Blastocatellia bacterium]